MGLNFIDISSWQAGINIATLFECNPLDGIIVKATEGQAYVNPYCDPWIQQAIKLDKPWGFYHFLKGGNGIKEAEYFVKHCENYFGDGLPCVDYEADAQHYGAKYVYDFCITVYQLTGAMCLIYTNRAGLAQDVEGFRPLAQAGYQLWLADPSAQTGTNFDSQKKIFGSYAPFDHVTVHQFSWEGKLNGWQGKLDLDIFNGGREDWDFMIAGVEKPHTDPEDDYRQMLISTLDDDISLLEQQLKRKKEMRQALRRI